MAKITAKEWRVLDNMETTPLLDVVGVIDRVRSELADSDGLNPPQIRDDFLTLHQLGLQVRQRGGEGGGGPPPVSGRGRSQKVKLMPAFSSVERWPTLGMPAATMLVLIVAAESASTKAVCT